MLDNVVASTSELPTARKTCLISRHEVTGGFKKNFRSFDFLAEPRYVCTTARSTSAFALAAPRGALLIKKLIPRESDRHASAQVAAKRAARPLSASFERIL